MPGELTFMERVRRRASSELPSFIEQVRGQAAQQEQAGYAQQQAELAHARGVLESSPIPGLRALTTEVGADIVSLGARIIGKSEYADRMNRFANSIEQAAGERDVDSFLPAILSRGARGAGRSMGTMIPAGAVAGPYGAIAIASAQETNRAITEGRDAGLKGRDLAEYAATQGVIEAVPAAAMQVTGLGGVESIFGKKTVSVGIKEGLKRLGITLAQELPEEIVTELSHNIAAKFADVDPNAMDADVIVQTIADTVVQTWFTVGFGGAPGVARSIKAGKVKKITDEMATMAEEGRIPSRKKFREWKMAPEVGTSRSQRRAFSQELAKQLEEPSQEEVVPEAPEAALTPAEAEGVLAPEVVQEGLAEPLEAPVEPGEAQVTEELPPEVTESLLAPQVGDDETVALNKAESNQILKDLGKSPLEDPGVEHHTEVLAAVSRDKADEKAIDNAIQIVSTRRGGTAYEHAAMVLKAGKLMNEGKQVRAEIVEAKKRGDTKEFNRLTTRLKGSKVGEAIGRLGIESQIELLARADAYSGTEVARSLSIRNLRLSRENFDVVSITQDLIRAKGPESGSLTQEENSMVGEFSDKILKGQAEIEELKAELAAVREAKAKVEAQKVLDSVKPKRGAGRAIKEKAAVEIEDIKARIRALGEVGRVNDILGVSAEGTYLIGRLGIAYIKSGVGTLVEVAENLRASMPEANLSDRDVWEALIASNPKLKARAKTEAERSVANLQAMSRSLIKIDNMAQGLSMEAATKPEISQELARLRKMEADLSKRLKAEEDLEKARQGEFREGVKRPADSPVISAIKAEINKLRSLQKITKKVELARKGVFDPVKRRAAVLPKIKELQKEYTKLRNEAFSSDIDKAKLERAIATVNNLQDLLDTGKKRIKKVPKEVPPELAEYQEQAKQLRTELRVDEEQANVDRQLETGEYDPPKQKKVAEPIDPRLERKQIKLAKDKKELRQRIADSAPWGAIRVAKEVASLMKSMKATADVSFTMRQNMWQVFSHPVRTSKAFIPSLKAFFNEYSSDQIRNSMVEGPNGFLYMKHGLAILDADSPSSRERSEIFVGNAIERSELPGLKIWGAVMRASSRHAVTIGNLVRTSAFDQFVDNHPNATDAELTTFADYLNVSTGIGNLGRFGAIGDELQETFFSPKFAVSRIQTPLAVVKHWKQPRVRKEIVKDMVKVVSTGGMVAILAALAGADVEWKDQDDPDWMKIRTGNTRRDIFGGFLQPARLIARLAKTLVGLRGEDDKFGSLEATGRFVSYKLAPIWTTGLELIEGETPVGKKVEDIAGVPYTSRLRTLIKIPIPLVQEDIYDAWKQEGIPTSIETAIETHLGMGVSTYQDSRTAAFKKIRKYYERGQYPEAKEYKDNWNRQNSALPPSKRKKPIGTVKRLPKK